MQRSAIAVWIAAGVGCSGAIGSDTPEDDPGGGQSPRAGTGGSGGRAAGSAGKTGAGGTTAACKSPGPGPAPLARLTTAEYNLTVGDLLAPYGVTVPEQAIVPQGDSQFVFKIVDGKVQLTKVVIGTRREGRVEIVEGLAAGDQVVTAGAPAAHVPRIPEHTRVLSLEDRSDPVALLGSLISAGAENRVTVVFDSSGAEGEEVYVVGGRVADAASHPELRAEVQRLAAAGYLAG